MTFLEFFPVVVAISVWGSLLANKRIFFHIDNQAVVQIINKKSSKSPQVMALVRKFLLDTLHFNIIFRAEYINTKINAVADSIPRCQWRRFRSLAPHADPVPTPLPPDILADLTVETNRLLEASMSSNTWQTYSTAIGKFNLFRYLYGLPLDGLPPVDQVVQFIAYMSACNCAPSTIRTYI